MLGDAPLFVDSFLDGETLGDALGEALGDVDALGEGGPPIRGDAGLLLLVSKLVGLFIPGDPGSPLVPGDLDLALGDPGTESELGVQHPNSALLLEETVCSSS